jgi:hypothetical protein
MARYTKTVIINNNMGFDALHPGQWFKWAGAGGNGARGQWYGKTRAGADAVRHQSGSWGKLSDTRRAHLVRLWALQHGAK